ncbi:hypothetical protein ON010_g11513 [Phytophthora cinnamomi]|nr:hypothetical protein ON010_g11513 [Phytophthora cinnamomi]
MQLQPHPARGRRVEHALCQAHELAGPVPGDQDGAGAPPRELQAPQVRAAQDRGAVRPRVLVRGVARRAAAELRVQGQRDCAIPATWCICGEAAQAGVLHGREQAGSAPSAAVFGGEDEGHVRALAEPDAAAGDGARVLGRGQLARVPQSGFQRHPPPKAKQVPEAITAPLKTADAMLNEFDSELLEVVEDENDPDRLSNTMWGSPQPTLGIRRVLSVDDLDVHSYIDDASLPSPSFKTSPASHLASRRSARRLQRAMSAASLEKPLKQEVVVPSFSRWRFHSPNLVQRSFAVNGREQVEIRKLQVNLTEVYKTCEHHREILPFILRRGDHELAKSLVLKLVRSHIVDQQASLSDIVQLLTTVQTWHGSGRQVVSLVLQNVVDSEDESRGASSGDPTKPGQNPAEQALGRIKASPPARNARGFLLIRQAEFYRDVWSVILQDPNTAKSCNLSAYIIEYIKNLRDNKVPVENITYVAVAECFVATGDPGKLYQFLHYHVLTDSVKLAELMVRHGCAYPALMQVGLDMYFRLREICPLVRTLLDLGQAGRAIEIAWRNMGLTSCDAAVLPGVVFFDSLVKSGG